MVINRILITINNNLILTINIINSNNLVITWHRSTLLIEVVNTALYFSCRPQQFSTSSGIPELILVIGS